MTQILTKISIDPEVDHIQGNLSAQLVLLEYGDYECPVCREAHFYVKNLQKRFDQELCFVFRNFPLSEIHPHAEMAAEAAEEAGLQRKFWQMHDYLFEHQDALEKEDLIRSAQQICLEVDQFEKDLDLRVLQPRVERDVLSGLRNRVNGTPTFFINGVRYDGPYQEIDQTFHQILGIY